ncbi:MAG TPA: branched-chain amino acid ABC transporter permease [Desulfomonilaceae bacterium]|nr:branched-chain amino acid ABC transporter permease [Desulfomonilaceae bacterium]
MPELFQSVVNGVLLGGLYASIAIGLSIVFGVMRLVNLAHGDLLILAGYAGLLLATCFGISPLAGLVVIVPLLFIAGFGLQKHLFNRTMRQGPEPPLLTALGLSIVIQNTLLVLFTPDARFLSTDLSVQTVRITDSVVVSAVYLLGFLSGLGIIILLHAFLRGTALGIAIRASSDDEQTARLMGIDTYETYAYAAGIAAATAGVAGIVMGMTFTFYPSSGPQYLIIAFGVVVIGGMGSMLGTLTGGILLGLAQLVGGNLLGPGYQLLCGYAVLFAVLIMRPQGIFGGKVHD